MANIKKNFNFRNGVQVDDDNLLVTSTGLVGIGTTVPSEALDVRGNVNITGFCSFTTANIGIMTISTIKPTEIIGAGVSIKSGIVTAEGAGIVTYYGDARFLQGMPTSQWADIDVGLGFTSIYNAGGNVGIATTDPRATLQIGGDVDSSQEGIGISSVGNIKATGIVTASSFVGNLTGNVTGNLTGNIASATTISGNVDLNGDLDVDGHTNLDNVSISGVSTFSENIDFLGNPAGIAQTSIQFYKGDGTNSNLDAINLYDNAAINVGKGHTGSIQIRGNFNSTGASPTFNSYILAYGDNFFIDGGSSTSMRIRTQFARDAIVANSDNGGSGTVELYHSVGGTATKKLETSGVGVTITNQLDTTNIVASGVITATTELNSPLIGVGTDVPVNPIQVRGTGNTEIQVTSDTGIAGLTVGRESGTGNTNNAEFRYGGGAGANYSSAQSLDILNYGTGNFNYHISVNNPGAAAGDFHWHKGLNNERLMTLTNTGRLGIGLTTPSTPLHVLGAGTISGSLSVGNNLTVSGNLNSDVTGNVTGNLTGNVTGNINAATGISTFNNVVGVAATFTSGRINSTFGIGLNASEPFSVNSNINNRVFVSASGNVGIKTTNTDGNTLLVAGSIVGQIIGAGTTIPLSTVDFSLAGQGLTGSYANKMFMIPPKVTNAQRGNLTGLVSGAMIYNTNLNKLQVYNGSAWETVTSS